MGRAPSPVPPTKPTGQYRGQTGAPVPQRLLGTDIIYRLDVNADAFDMRVAGQVFPAPLAPVTDNEETTSDPEQPDGHKRNLATCRAAPVENGVRRSDEEGADDLEGIGQTLAGQLADSCRTRAEPSQEPDVVLDLNVHPLLVIKPEGGDPITSPQVHRARSPSALPGNRDGRARRIRGETDHASGATRQK